MLSPEGWVSSPIQPCPMCMTTLEDQVNHFGWQMEGEETAATGQPQGGDSALLCHCHLRHCLRPRTWRKPTGQLISCPTSRSAN